jgi:hypothetical protein
MTAGSGDRALRVWRALSRWAVPVMMALAYALLAATSDTDAVGKAWMAAGLGLVMIAWFSFRALTASAALARALGVGDTERLLALADRGLAGRGGPVVRARLGIGCGLARLLRGELAAAREALDAAVEDARAAPELAPLAAALRTVVQVELGVAVDDAALAASRSSTRAPWLAALADGATAWRAGRLDAAAAQLARVIDDIRAGSALRAIAHVYAARVAAARGDAAAAARHRAAAADLAAPDAAWLRGR